MNKTTYSAYLEFYAKKCLKCKGERHIIVDNVATACPCQFTATMKWRFDQIKVRPESLKYKTWSDFTGLIKNEAITVENDAIITGMLDPESVKYAKEEALKYCYRNGDNSSFKNLIVHKHLVDGKNVVISGGKNTGKSLLAVLIVKEVVCASAEYKIDMDFHWATSTKIRNASRWTNEKDIDDEYMSYLGRVDWLVIDDVDIENATGHHTNPPDRISLNSLFSTRSIENRPTIFICSEKMSSMRNPRYIDVVEQQWGKEFVNTFMHHNNLVIALRKHG